MRKFIGNITKVVLDKVTPNEVKKIYLRALSNITIFLFFRKYKDIMYMSANLPVYTNSVNQIASVLGIESDKLHFIIDILSKDPSRIFRFKDNIPKINPSKLNFTGEISKRRLNLISEVLGIRLANVKRTAALWTYSQSMINTATITFKKGEKEDIILKSLAKDILGVDQQFLYILIDLKVASQYEKMTPGFEEYLADFLITLLHNRASIFPSWDNDEGPSDDFDWDKVDLEKIWKFKKPEPGSFTYFFKQYLDQSDDNIRKGFERIAYFSKQEYDQVFMLLTKISEFKVGKNPKYFGKILKIEEKNPLLKGIIDLFSQKNIN